MSCSFKNKPYNPHHQHYLPNMEKKKEYPIRTGCDRGLCSAAIGRQDRQLNTYDWLADVPGNAESTDLVEVQFKHTRKGYYHNVNNLTLTKFFIHVAQHSSRPQGPVPPMRPASCRAPICFISMRTWKAAARSLMSWRKSTRSSAM